jgi:hypothetical protein
MNQLKFSDNMRLADMLKRQYFLTLTVMIVNANWKRANLSQSSGRCLRRGYLCQWEEQMRFLKKWGRYTVSNVSRKDMKVNREVVD